MEETREGVEIAGSKHCQLECPPCSELVRKVQFLLVLIKGNLKEGEVQVDRLHKEGKVQVDRLHKDIYCQSHSTCKMMLFLECRLEWVESRGSAPPSARHNPRNFPPPTSTLE